MEITRAQRQQAEERASEVQLRLYAEPEAGEQLWTIAGKYGLTQRATYRTFSQFVGDIILGFYKQSDIEVLITTKLSQLNFQEQIKLKADIENFLLPLSESNNEAKIKDDNLLDERLTYEIKQTERELEELQGIRTMATDMREAQTQHTPTYQSSQSDLIQPSVPTPPAHSGPRWETDT